MGESGSVGHCLEECKSLALSKMVGWLCPPYLVVFNAVDVSVRIFLGEIISVYNRLFVAVTVDWARGRCSAGEINWHLPHIVCLCCKAQAKGFYGLLLSCSVTLLSNWFP